MIIPRAYSVLLGFIFCLSPVSAQQDHSVGGEWELQFIYAPRVIQPQMDGTMRSMRSLGDVDGDGIPDLAFVSESGNGSHNGLFAISGESGSQLWHYGYSLSLGIGAFPANSFSSIPDLDGDGIPELLAGDRSYYAPGQSSISGIVFLHSGRTGDLIWQGYAATFGDALGRGVAGLGDVNGDGIPDFALSTGNELNWTWWNAIHILSGADQSIISSIKNTSAGPVFGRLTGLDQQVDADLDGVPDFLVDGDGFTTRMVSPVTGQTLYVVDDCQLAYSGGPTQAAVIDDIDGDGVPEFVAPLAWTSGVACHSGKTGIELWRRELAGDAGDAATTVFDLDGDGFRDIAIGAPLANIANSSHNGKIHFLSGTTGQRIRRINAGAIGLPYEQTLGIALIYDDSSEILYTRESQWYANSQAGALIALKFEPYLTADAESISAQAGGAVQFTLDFPDDHAGQLYALAVSGVDGPPTVIQDVKVPLASSPLLRASINSTLPPVFPGGNLGILDTAGNGAVQMSLPPGLLSSRIGSFLYFAAVTGPTTKDLTASSVAVKIEITL